MGTTTEKVIQRRLAGTDRVVKAVFDFPVVIQNDDGEWITRNSWSLKGAGSNWDPSYIIENEELVELNGYWEAMPELPFIDGDC